MKTGLLLIGLLLIPPALALSAEPDIPIPKGRFIIRNIRNTSMHGTVKSITKTEIVVEGSILYGVNIDTIVFGMHKFHLSKLLLEGKSGNTELPSYSYRVQDLNVGDKIRLIYDRVDMIHTCTEFSIRRRLGGHVPAPPIPEKPGSTYSHEEAMNAHQDFEERGYPLPEKYDSAAYWRKYQAISDQMAVEAELRVAMRANEPPKEKQPAARQVRPIPRK